MSAAARTWSRTGLPVSDSLYAVALGTFGRIEAQRQRVGEPRQCPVGAAHHGVLLVQNARNAHQARRQERRKHRIAAETDDSVGLDPAELRPGIGPRPRGW